MPKCSRFEYTTEGSNGKLWDVYSQTTVDVETCGETDANQMVILTGIEYQNLTPAYSGLAAGDQFTVAIALIVSVCAFMGFRAGNAIQ